MSHESDETRLIELVHHADEARSRLRQDVEALAYKLSLENLKQEAIDVSHEVAAEVKATAVRWGHQTKVVAQEHPIALTLTVAFGGLLYTGLVRRNRGLLFGALACGAGAVGAVVLRARASNNRGQLARPSGHVLVAREA